MKRSLLGSVAAIGVLSVIGCGSSDSTSSTASGGAGGGAANVGGSTANTGGSTVNTGGSTVNTGGSTVNTGGSTANTGGSAAGDTTIIATGITDPNDVAVDATSIYWTEANGSSVLKVALSGGTPTTIVATAPAARSIAVDATSVYWVGSVNDSPTINSAGLDGSSPKVLYTGAQDAELGDGIAVSGGLVFFVVGGFVGPGLNSIPIAGATTATPVGMNPAGLDPDKLVASNATGVFYKGQNAGALSTDVVFATYDGATTTTVGSISLTTGGSLKGVSADDTSGYYIVEPTSDGPYPFFAAPISGAGATQVFAYAGEIENPLVVGGKYYFANTNSGGAGIFVADTTGAATAFFTPADQGEGSNEHRLFRTTTDKTALVWVTGSENPGGAAFHKKAF